MPREVFILKSGRCAWGGCVFCGYGRIIGEPAKIDTLRIRIDDFFGKLKGDVDEICVYGSGSFLDEDQVPRESRQYFAGKCSAAGIKSVTVESRPEYVKKDALADFKGLRLTVAFGLEAANDAILKKLRKGFTLSEFEKAAKIVRENKCKVRAYLLVNPPYIKSAGNALARFVEYGLAYADSIVLINTLPHANSPLFEQWITGEWNYLSKKEFEETTSKYADNPRIDLDVETYKFTPRFPENKKEKLSGVGEKYLTHPHYEVWQDYLVRWYEPPENRKTLLFLPCSYRKPYSESETHKKIIRMLDESGKRASLHEVMLSNAGLVPRQFEDRYPFNSYDWAERDETTEIKRRYIEVTSERIMKYLDAHGEHYDNIICYLKYDSESYQALIHALPDAKNLLTSKTYNKIKDGKSPLTNELALQDLLNGLRV